MIMLKHRKLNIVSHIYLLSRLMALAFRKETHRVKIKVLAKDKTVNVSSVDGVHVTIIDDHPYFMLVRI